jgi:hypothetical protein
MLYEAICTHQSVNIRQTSQDWATQMGYYRFLDNEHVSIAELKRSLASHCQQQVEGFHVLSVSDSSEINLQSPVGRIDPEGLGVVGNDRDLGFFMHPSLVLNAASGFPLGISEVQLWSRPSAHLDKHRRKYKELPIEEKESFKWLESAAESQQCLDSGGATLVTHIGEREADIYEEWVRLPNRRPHLLIRACRDRLIAGTTQPLFAYLSEQPCEGTYSFRVMADPRKGRTQREAWMAVRFTRVAIQRPKRLNGTEYPASVSLYALEAQEIHPPTGQSPVHWCLLTTHAVVCIQQALQVIRWYSWRWRIEQLFATLKQGGLDLESTQLESGKAIQRLCVLALAAALQVLQLTEGRHDETQTATVVFSDAQQQCLTHLAPTLDGRTAKQQNPYPPFTLAWATWLIARLEGGLDCKVNALQESGLYFRAYSSSTLSFEVGL